MMYSTIRSHCSGSAPPPRPTMCRSTAIRPSLRGERLRTRRCKRPFCLNRGVAKLTVGDRSYEIHRIDELQSRYDAARLPYTLRVLLEHVVRNGGEEDVEAVATWVATDEPSREISFAPSRVLLQDLTG